MHKFQYELRSSVNMFDIWFFLLSFLQAKRFGSPLLILKLNTWNFFVPTFWCISRIVFQGNNHFDNTFEFQNGRQRVSSGLNLERYRHSRLPQRCRSVNSIQIAKITGIFEILVSLDCDHKKCIAWWDAADTSTNL